MKKIISGMLILIMLVSLTACRTGGIYIDPNRTQIYASIYDGGFGTQWLDDVAKKFEAENPEYQVIVQKSKIEYNNIKAELQSGTSTSDIYFSDNVKLEELIYLNLISDITDAVNTPIQKEEDADGNAKTIASKMYDQDHDYYSRGEGEEKKYYGVPFITSFTGIIYDHDLFERKGFLRYGKGPDGVAGTYDDGLPSTFAQFDDMVRFMANSGVWPFSWSGQYHFYLWFVLYSLWAQYEGTDNFALNFSFNGTDSNLGQITPETGYKVYAQQGRYESLKFVENYLLNTAYRHPDSYKTSVSHRMAQDNFILSEKADKPIAMHIDGAWWENEARGTFYSAYGEKNYGTRDFRMMPLPKMPGQKGLNDDGSGSFFYNFVAKTSIFINKGSKEQVGAKKLLVFANSDESMSTFTKYSNSIRGLQYEMLPEDLQGMTKFGKNICEMFADKKNITIVNDRSLSPLINYTDLGIREYRTTVNETVYEEPARIMMTDKSVTARNYFEGMKKYHENSWAGIYDSVKNYF